MMDCMGATMTTSIETLYILEENYGDDEWIDDFAEGYDNLKEAISKAQEFSKYPCHIRVVKHEREVVFEIGKPDASNFL